MPDGLADYVYTSPALGTSLLVIGHALLYNHGGDRANIGWSVPTDAALLLTREGLVRFYARREIAVGEELLASYSDEYWDSRGLTPS